VVTEFVISQGWIFLGIYGNIHRLKDSIIFKISSI
jgi:hypothetical protein